MCMYRLLIMSVTVLGLKYLIFTHSSEVATYPQSHFPLSPPFLSTDEKTGALLMCNLSKVTQLT